ncbi:hypothetical protein SLEP1_g26853 [Rubroshorea leprosula]|uniref:Uncharacterized protein n=1 Tax=Rubroshorea leprosula TaxID=152421 RepID=A0AAV5JUU2_9ROSI|nr:hypothetical protein SLEP1_g26853 [Rubroshorea leprosula]
MPLCSPTPLLAYTELARTSTPAQRPCSTSSPKPGLLPTPLTCPTPYHRTSHHHTLARLQPALQPADSASLLLHPSSLQQPTPPLCAALLLQQNLSAPPLFCNRILHPTLQPTEHETNLQDDITLQLS